MDNKALFLLFLFLSASYCRTFSTQPPKASDLQLQGGKSAPGFDANKIVGRAARSEDDDPEPPTVPDPKPIISGLPDDGHTEEKRFVPSGGNKASNFNINRAVGRAVADDYDQPSTDLGPDPTGHFPPPDDGHKEEKRAVSGGNKASNFNINKAVGRAVAEDSDYPDPSTDLGPDPTGHFPPPDDGHKEEKRIAPAGGNKAPGFDATKPVGTKVGRSTLDLTVDDILGPPFPIPEPPPPSTDDTHGEDGGGDGHREEKRSVGGNMAAGWKRMI